MRDEHNSRNGLAGIVRSLIDCRQKTVRVQTPNGGELTIQGEGLRSNSTLYSITRSKRYLQHACEGYLAYVIDTREEKKEAISEVPIVCDFPEVSPEDLPGVSSERPAEFMIVLVPGAAPVINAPYHLAPPEMHEFSNQLQELMYEGFIQPSISPWGASFLFVKKKDELQRMCIYYRGLNKLTGEESLSLT